jgi:RND superfamily putative drug exporter
MLGLGLAIDYALFMTSRFREELERGSVHSAVAVTVGTAGRAVFFSGLTVLIGLGGLAMFDFMFLRSVGVAGMLVVGVSVVGALTLLPAVLAVAGSRVNSLQVVRRGVEDQGRFWVRLSNLVMDHPWRFFLPVLALLLALGTPFLWVNLSSPDATILPTNVDSRQGLETLRAEFGDGEINPIVVALETDSSVSSPENLAALYAFTRHFAADERVMRIDSIVSLDHRLSLEQYTFMYADGSPLSDQLVAAFGRLASEHTTAVFLYPRGLSNDDETKQLLADVRAYGVGGDFRMLVDGGTAEIVDVVDAMYAQFPRVAALVVLATYLVLLIQFRSVILPLKAILMNALSIAASYGAVVVIFQEGVFSSLLGFSAQGYVEASLPILMFCVLFGLSMDYEVFLLSRIREEYLRTGDNRTSVALGLQRSGRIITGAALIVVVVTLSFVSAEIVLVKAFGLGIAIAIFVDATIIRALLVPATMRLLGDLNWWLPSWLRRALPKQEFVH